MLNRWDNSSLLFSDEADMLERFEKSNQNKTAGSAAGLEEQLSRVDLKSVEKPNALLSKDGRVRELFDLYFYCFFCFYSPPRLFSPCNLLSSQVKEKSFVPACSNMDTTFQQ